MRSALLAVLILSWLVPASAEDPCAADAARLCPRAERASELVACLRDNDGRLAPACRDWLSALLVMAKEYGKDCEADAKRLCADAPIGEGGLARCLRDNESSLSQSCQGAMNRVRLERAELQAKCAGDVGRFCATVREGEGRLLGCLREHEAQLDSTCRSAVKKLP